MRKNLNDLFNVLGKYQWHYFFSTILLFISIVARSLEPKVLQIAVDYMLISSEAAPDADKMGKDFVSKLFNFFLPALSNENMGKALLALGLFYLVISFIRGGFLFFSTALKDSTTEITIKKLRDRTFEHIQRLPLSYFSTISKGELIQRCTGDIDTIKRFIHIQIIAVLRLSGTFLFSFFMMYLIDWKYALISVMLAPLIFVLGFIYFEQERKVWTQHEEEADKLNTMVQENLNGIRVVTAFSNQEYEIARFGHQNRKKLEMGLKQSNLHTFFWPASDFMINLQMITSVIAGGYFTLSGRITVGELLGFFTYVGMVTYPMRQLGKVLSQMGMAIVAMGRISEILESHEEEDLGMQNPNVFSGKIELRNVSFAYDLSKDIKALDKISFLIEPGEQIAIIGPTGAGKTTIVKLLLRFYEPLEGQIFIDGKDIRDFPKSLLRQKIGVALQKAFLFSTTINKNIAYTREEIIEDEVAAAARIACAYELKQAFPQGFSTMVGERGVTLSGGQKQRVALARTVITAPDIIILDDTTSAVDTVTEKAILQELDNSLIGKTAIIISHRIASIQKANRVIVLEKGKVVQIGTGEELKRVQGYFQSVQQIQAHVEKEIYKDQEITNIS